MTVYDGLVSGLKKNMGMSNVKYPQIYIMIKTLYDFPVPFAVWVFFLFTGGFLYEEKTNDYR